MALTKVNTDLLADGGKLNGIEAGADVTDTTNVTAAGALMDSELTSIASVKALDQGVATTDSPTFAGLNASGNLTLDVAGDIILDAGGDDITFKTGGVEFGSIFYSNSNLYLNSAISDGDMVFRGNDGGSAINALVLDMSAAGAATFNSSVTIPTTAYVGTSIVHQGDSDTSIDFGSNLIDFYSGGSLGIRLQPIGATFNETGASNVDFRVESDANSHMLFVDAGANAVGINASLPRTTLHVNVDGATGGTTNDWNNDKWFLIADGSGASDSGFGITHTAASGTWINSLDPYTAWRNITVNGDDFKYFQGGSREIMALGYSGAVFNDGSSDADFRVESDSNSHMLYVDGGENVVTMGMANPTIPSFVGNNSVMMADNLFMFQAADSGESNFNISQDNNFVYLLHNGYYNGAWKQHNNGFGVQMLRMGSSQFQFEAAADVGADDTNVTFSNIFRGGLTEVCVNDSGGAVDFRVESDGVSNMLQVDAASNGVGIRVDGDGNQSLKIKSTGSTGNMTLVEDESINGAYTPYYQYKVAYIAGNSSNTQLTIPFKPRSYNQTGYLKIRVIPALHNLTTIAQVATAEFALGLAYSTTVSVGAVLSSSGNYASATGNSSNQLIITFSNNYSNATMSGAFIHVEFFGQQGTSGAPEWNNIAFN